jgi:intracellular septation protein A
MRVGLVGMGTVTPTSYAVRRPPAADRSGPVRTGHMTLTTTPPAAAVAHRPTLASVLRRVALSLTVACAVPATLFFTSYQLFGIWPAILVALVWSYGAIAWRAATGRRTSGLLVLTAVVLTGRTVVALLAQSTFLYFLQPIITDGVVAATFLLSLASARPLVARLAGDFYPMDAELSLRPRIQRLFWHLTAMWAVVCLAKSLVMLWALNSLSLDTFVLVKSISMPASNLLAVTVTVCAAVLVARQEGLVGPAARTA